MKSKNSRWIIVVGGVTALLLLAAIVYASPPPSPSAAPLQSTPGFDADKVDGHHAAYSGKSNPAKRANKVLWATSGGTLHQRSLPKSWLNKQYVNDNQVETIQAATGGYVLTVDNTGSGHGLKGEAGSGGDGVVGQAFHSLKSGVYGVHDGSGYGVTGRSTNGFGVLAVGAGDASGTDTKGDLLLHGTRGEIFTFGNYLNLYTNYNVNIDLDNDNNDANGGFRIWNGAENEVFRVEEDGDTWSAGTKSAVVQTQSYGPRLMYAMESAGVWFEDFGTASLVDGAATVAIEPIFAETVNLGEDYHVFLTPLGDCNGLYVAAKAPTSFEVRELGGGTASIAFDYRIVAKRLGYEGVRLDEPQLSSSAEGTREAR